MIRGHRSRSIHLREAQLKSLCSKAEKPGRDSQDQTIRLG
jgi:hypothetical protein